MTESVQQRISALEKKVGAQSKSPLFAQLADFYLEAGRAKDALRVCDEGLANFPFFSTGHLIKGKALAALHMVAEARREFEWVQEFFPANETIANLVSEVPPGPAETIAESIPEPTIQEPPAPEPVAPEPVVPEPPEPMAPEVIQAAAPEVVEPVEVPAMEPEPLPEPPIFETPAPSSGFDFGAPPQPEAIPEAVPPPEVAPETPAPVSTEDIFGLGTPPAPVETAPPSEPAPEQPEPSPFGDFGFPSSDATPAEPPTTPVPPAAEAENVFGFPTAQEPEAPQPTPTEEESFEQYSARMRTELDGENSLTLEEYLGQSQDQTPPPSGGSIEEITQKLQTAKKITPIINFAQRATTAASQADTPSSSGFVTPTLAEIYAKQGWYDDAIKAYKTLILTKPAEVERFQKRIEELEELKKKQS